MKLCRLAILLGICLAACSPSAAEESAPAVAISSGNSRPGSINPGDQAATPRRIQQPHASGDKNASTVLLRLPPCEPTTAAKLSPTIQGAAKANAASRTRAAAFIEPAELPRPAQMIPAQQIAEQLNLGDALALAMERNPNLIAMRQNEPISRAALDVARTYPFNPFVQFEALPINRTIQGTTLPVFNYVLLMQTLELAHQSRYRDAAGIADLTRTQWTIHQAELFNLALTERMFFFAVYQRSVRDLSLALATLNEELVSVLQRRFEAAQAAASDVALARLQAHAARQQANLAIAAYNAAVLDLRTQIGQVFEGFEPRGDLTLIDWQPILSGNIEQSRPEASDVIELVSGRPDVMAARADLSFSQANANLARANRRPNLQIGPYYQRDDFATTFFGFRSQIDIPVINNGMPLWRQRMAEVRQREIALQQILTRAELEAQAAIERYERARRLIQESQNDFASALAADLRRVENQYQAGQADLVRLYAARTGLLQAKRAQLDTLSELANAAARVTETTGLPPYRVVRLMQLKSLQQPAR